MNFQKNTLGVAVFVALTAPPFAVAEQEINEEIITIASRVEMPIKRVGSSMSLLTTEDIRHRGYATLVDVLRSLPSISVTRNGGPGQAASLRIRGEAGYRTLVLIDGVDVSDPTGTQVSPQVQHILAADIERVEVLRGPQGMMYGADAGGVINVITHRGSDTLNGNIDIEQGRYGTTRATANVGGKAGTLLDYSLSISDLESDGFNAWSVDPTEDRDGYNNTTINGKLGVRFSNDWRAELVVRDVASESGYDGCFDRNFSSVNDCLSITDQANYKLIGHYDSDSFSQQLSYGSTDVDREFFSADISTYKTEGTIDQLQYLGRVEFSGGRQLVFGSDWEQEDILASANSLLNRKQLGVYVEWQGNAGDNFYYTAGLRGDDNDDVGRHNSVRLTSAYLLSLGNDQLKIKASYGNGFRAPALSETAYNDRPSASPTLEKLSEEQSQGFDIGVEYISANGTTAELVYFDQDIEDEIFFDLTSFSGYLQSTGLTRSRGIELSASAPLGDSLSLTGNYTYTESADRNGDPRRRVPGHLYNLGITGQWFQQALNISANMRWVRDVTDGAVQLDDYQVLDINASYQVTDALSIYVRAENALDDEYQEIATYNASRAAFYSGVRYSF